jgi:hypothetical protein
MSDYDYEAIAQHHEVATMTLSDDYELESTESRKVSTQWPISTTPLLFEKAEGAENGCQISVSRGRGKRNVGCACYKPGTGPGSGPGP